MVDRESHLQETVDTISPLSAEKTGNMYAKHKNIRQNRILTLETRKFQSRSKRNISQVIIFFHASNLNYNQVGCREDSIVLNSHVPSRVSFSPYSIVVLRKLPPNEDLTGEVVTHFLFIYLKITWTPCLNIQEHTTLAKNGCLQHPHPLSTTIALLSIGGAAQRQRANTTPSNQARLGQPSSTQFMEQHRQLDWRYLQQYHRTGHWPLLPKFPYSQTNPSLRL